MKIFIALFFCLLLSPAWAQKKPKTSASVVELSAEKWAFDPGTVVFLEYKSRPAMQLLPEAGFAVLKDHQWHY